MFLVILGYIYAIVRDPYRTFFFIYFDVKMYENRIFRIFYGVVDKDDDAIF